MRADIARLRTLEKELEQMRRKYARMVPEMPDPFDPVLMAVQGLAQSANGNRMAADYLEKAIKEEGGG